MRYAITALVLPTFMAVFPAAAQQLTTPVELAVPAVTGAAVERGKPLVLTPPPAAARPNDTAGCTPVLPCGARVLGAVEKNGAVAIEFPALKW